MSVWAWYLLPHMHSFYCLVIPLLTTLMLMFVVIPVLTLAALFRHMTCHVFTTFLY
jgi:hypothetical protein